AQKLSEEAHTMGSLQCTRVSAELKTARSIVRLTEIQATLQEQSLDYFYFGALPPVKLNVGRVLGSKAIADDGLIAVKLNPPDGVDGT
ncbi:hypothetical protein PV326_012171, partial [Microctonus aethiopoides]